MTVRVDELTSDVTVEPHSGGGAAATGAQPSPAERGEDVRALMERLARDAERTRAEAYGD